ncbi:hypothetical protein RFI_00143 [Reticulomyxa filosa]|uniref:RRM domain-containing protein n=1 Tax=Reticulomyxa filosa TaxID=46433 RepID=X6PFF0_RETFI|nr:hypothetical protein RFI_00143 [Reticulomyxa filosa]|eukprot:ETO36921.1 hypothetical protein RFI_00143 [Reticulomyxa filosa]
MTAEELKGLLSRYGSVKDVRICKKEQSILTFFSFCFFFCLKDNIQYLCAYPNEEKEVSVKFNKKEQQISLFVRMHDPESSAVCIFCLYLFTSRKRRTYHALQKKSKRARKLKTRHLEKQSQSTGSRNDHHLDSSEANAKFYSPLSHNRHHFGRSSTGLDRRDRDRNTDRNWQRRRDKERGKHKEKERSKHTDGHRSIILTGDSSSHIPSFPKVLQSSHRHQ